MVGSGDLCHQRPPGRHPRRRLRPSAAGEDALVGAARRADRRVHGGRSGAVVGAEPGGRRPRLRRPRRPPGPGGLPDLGGGSRRPVRPRRGWPTGDRRAGRAALPAEDGPRDPVADPKGAQPSWYRSAAEPDAPGPLRQCLLRDGQTAHRHRTAPRPGHPRDSRQPVRLPGDRALSGGSSTSRTWRSASMRSSAERPPTGTSATAISPTIPTRSIRGSSGISSTRPARSSGKDDPSWRRSRR